MPPTTPLSSSPSSETSVKLHPYQHFDNKDYQPGPKHAFETRTSHDGFHVRVDMPGVPSGAVKVVKYNETRTVTFTGKAPPLWPGIDSDNGRVYAGYVVLDRDPSGIDFTSDVNEGVLRLFFPSCDGSLHFLSPHNAIAQDVEPGQDEEEESGADDGFSFIHHSPFEPSGIALSGGRPEHINPYQLSGTKGVYEHKVVTVNGEHLIYVRLDCAGTCRKTNLIMENLDRAIMFQAVAYFEGVRFGEGTREFSGFLLPQCNCCRYKVVMYDTTDGVLRFLIRRSNDMDLTPVFHCTMPPAGPGGDLQPMSLPVFGKLPRTIESSK